MDSPNKYAPRNSALRLLWQEAVNEVTSFIKPYLRDRASLPVNSVVKSGSGYRVGYRFIPDFRSILNKHSKSIEKLPSVRKSVTALIDDAYLVKQIARTHRNDATISRDDLEPIAHLHLSQIVESVLYGHDFGQLYQSYSDRIWRRVI